MELELEPLAGVDGLAGEEMARTAFGASEHELGVGVLVDQAGEVFYAPLRIALFVELLVAAEVAVEVGADSYRRERVDRRRRDCPRRRDGRRGCRCGRGRGRSRRAAGQPSARWTDRSHDLPGGAQGPC